MGFRVASDVESERRNKKYNAGASTSHHSSMTQENVSSQRSVASGTRRSVAQRAGTGISGASGTPRSDAEVSGRQ
uniref:Uncharacterized protein n=1 Tax=Fagus sylvatica TaxID=28930 RepID=A0A2N9IQ92_FAGSY